MTELKVLTWNVRGLNNYIKTRRVLAAVKRTGANIIFLQETHLVQDTHAKVIPSWCSHGYYSSFASNSRGVLILIHKSLRFEPAVSISDDEGRYVLVSGKIGTESVTLVNVYGPNFDSPDFYTEVATKCHPFLETLVIWGGDFNAVLDMSLDRASTVSRPSSKTCSTLNSLFEFYDLVEIWRCMFPDRREYSYFSDAHDMSSRIDYVVVPKEYIGKVKACEYLPRTYSDHSPLLLSLALSAGAPRARNWRLKADSLLDTVFRPRCRMKSLLFSPRNEGTAASKAIVWEAFKATMRVDAHIVRRGNS